MVSIRHGMAGTKTYRCWSEMKARCNYEKHTSYKNYGGRGITYDSNWENFEEFYKDMGKAPCKHDLDRIDNSKGYSKENCRYIVRSTNLANKRRSHGAMGAYLLKTGSFASSITIQSKRYRIGVFKTMKEAQDEYIKMFHEWYGFYPNKEMVNDN